MILLVRFCLHLEGGCLVIVTGNFSLESISYMRTTHSLRCNVPPPSMATANCRLKSTTTAVLCSAHFGSLHRLLPTEALLWCCGRLIMRKKHNRTSNGSFQGLNLKWESCSVALLNALIRSTVVIKSLWQEFIFCMYAQNTSINW